MKKTIVLGLLLLPTSALAQGWGQPLPPPQPLPPAPLGPPMFPQQPPPQQSSESDRGLEWVWGRAEVGVSYINLSFDGSALAIPSSSSGGLMLGAAAGARFLIFTLGARFRFHQAVDFNMWQLSPMVGLHIPSGNWDFGGDFYMGYAAVGSFRVPYTGHTPNGLHVGLEGGIDYYLVKNFSLGVTTGLEVLALGANGKTGVGLSFNLAPHAAVHF